ncbi:MAG: TraC family protein, partial [Proteobacteria bacterium]|nr:TraC family protein [Pseudomonadota bacterium]
QTFKHTMRELIRFKHIVADFAANSKIRLHQLDAQGVLDILRRFFNPKTYYKRSFAPYNPNESLAQQFIYSSPTLDYQGIEREGIKTRTISLKTSPQYAYPGGMAYFTKLSFPFTMSLNFNFPSKGKVKRFFDFKEFFLQNTPSAKARRQREEILEVQEKLAREDRCLHMTFNVTIEGETDDILDERTREIVNVFHNELECEVIVENDIGVGLCLNSLPLNYTPDSDMSAQRYIRILRSDAINFVPIFDSFRGLKNPLQLFLSRENNLVPFSLTENETSNHTVVLADSGSGKSAFVIDCIQAAKRATPEPLIFIIDKKSSYTMLSEYFDGDLTVFDRNDEVPFSPFRGVYDEDKIAFLTKLIITSVKLTSPSFEIESEHQASISRALKFAYIKKCKQQGLAYVDGELLQQTSDKEVELTMEDFVAELGALGSDGNERLRTAIDDLVHKLRPFYDDGIYAKFFRGSPNRKRKKCLFYAYDLDALDGDPVLQTLMTMAVVEEIRQTIKLPENRGRGGFIVFEEFAMLGRNNQAVRDFAVDMAETCRKLGFWLITLTPRPQNYFELDVGKAFWGVADNFIFLQMNADNVDYLAEHSSMLDQANVEIIKSLRTKRGQYAEVFYMNKKKTTQGALRYHPTPLSMWLSPTNAKAAAEADRALKMFAGRNWEALSMLAEKYPNGL